jgi:hypothetical protein
MITIPANFQTLLKKHTSRAFRYIVKMNGSSNTYYLSTEEMTITDSGTQRVYGLLLNTPTVKQTIDIYSGKSSVGGFSINLSDYDQGGGNYFSDNFASEYFYNREVKLYLHTDGITALADCPLLYVGTVSDWEIQQNRITINIENSISKVSKSIPTNIVTSADFPDAPIESLGKYLPIVYGDHLYRYGQDGTVYDVTRKKDSTMIKPVRIGFDKTDNYHEYIIADHLLKTKDTNFARVWMYLPNLGRYVKIDADNYTITESDGKTYLRLKQLHASFYVYDYWYANRIGGGDSFDDSVNAIDDDMTTYASKYIDPTIVSPPQTYNLEMVYPNYENDNISAYTEIVIWHRIKWNNAGDFTFSIGAGADEYTSAQSEDTLLKEDRLYSVYNAAQMSSPVTYRLTLDDDSVGTPSYCRIYESFKELKYKPAEIFPDQIFVACYGYDISGETYDANPGVVIKHIIDTYTDATPDSTALGLMETRTGNNWLLNIAIYKQDSIKSYLEKMAMQANSYFVFSANNEASCFTFTDSYTTSRAKIKPEDIKTNSLQVKKTNIQNAVNSLVLNYLSDSVSGIVQELTRANSTDETNIGQKSEKVISAEYVADDTTAGLLADHYCQDATTAFWGMPRNLIEFETADMRGANAGWDGADFEPIYALELFDIVELDHSEWDIVKKCNGESWDGKQFLVYEIARGLTTIKVKGLEL